MRQKIIFKINNQNLYEDMILIDDIYPLLFTCVDDLENTYLCSCYFADPSKILWLVTKTDLESVIDLLINKVTIRELFESDELWAICKSKNEEIQVKRIEDCKNFDEKAFPAEGEYMDADTGEFEEEIAILKKRV
ncbi:hypothetical protein [Eubacterium ramulus]